MNDPMFTQIPDASVRKRMSLAKPLTSERAAGQKEIHRIKKKLNPSMLFLPSFHLLG